VLIVVQNLPLRLDRRVRTECRALTDAGYDVSVICPREEKDEPRRHLVDRTRVYSYPPTPPTKGVLGYVREYAECWTRTALLSVRVHRDRPFDVIQTCNPPDTYWLLGRIWKVLGRRFVFDQHDLCPEVYEVRFGRRGLLHRALLAFERQNYRTADRLISPNPMYRELALARGAVDPQHAVVVMSTPDPGLMRRGPAHPELRGGRAHLVCYVGVMGPQDGVDHLLEAVDSFVHGLGRSDTRFALLGFGDCLDELRADCSARGLDPWVHFTGKVDHEEIGRWLSTADIGVTPDPCNDFNDRSTMNKTLEYMAHEVPVVATDLRETRRCADDAAVYVTGDRPEETARALAGLLDDPARREAMGRRGRFRIENELAWSRQAATYVGVFDDLLGRVPVGDTTRRAS
jgi:glycosyltransferase involved in cell wall biosynthesis